MVSILQSSAGIMAVFLASVASTEAAYGQMYTGSCPLMTLGPRMLPAHIDHPSLFSGGMGRVMHDFDKMFDHVLGDLNGVFYEPFLWQRSSRLSHLLPGSSVLNTFVQGKTRSKDLVKNAHRTTQDEKQLQFVVDIPDVKAGDINLQLEENGRLLKISGEANYQQKGISVQSRFERSFMLPPDVNTSEISAEMDGGILTIIVPKSVATKENVRQIDIVEKEKVKSEGVVDKRDEADASASGEKEESQKAKADVLDELETIDLDVEQE